MDSEKALLSRDEAAEILRIGKTTLWRLVRAKQIRVVQIGRRTLFLRSEIDQFIEGLDGPRDESHDWPTR